MMKRKYKILLIIIGIILVIIQISCLVAFISYKESPDERPSIFIEEWEKEILYNLPIEQTPTQIENIRNGNLDSSQKFYLKGLRNLTIYLKEKYPSYDCKIQRIGIEGLIDRTIKYCFTVSGFSKEYEAILKDNNSFSDNFYSKIYSLEYSNEIRSEVQKFNKNIINVNTDFYSYTDMETREGLNIEEFKKLKLNCNTDIYVNVNTNNELEELKQIIRKLDLYGSYTIYNSTLFQNGMTSAECKDIWKNNRNAVEHTSFNSWD